MSSAGCRLAVLCAVAMLAAGCAQTIEGTATRTAPGIDDESQSPVDVESVMLDQAQMQAKLGKFLDDLAGGLGGAVDRLKQLEPSPVQGGDAVKNKIIEAYGTSQVALRDAGAKMKAGDQDAAGQVMQSLGDETAKMVDPFKDNDTAELRDAMSKAPRCKDIPSG